MRTAEVDHVFTQSDRCQQTFPAHQFGCHLEQRAREREREIISGRGACDLHRAREQHSRSRPDTQLTLLTNQPTHPHRAETRLKASHTHEGREVQLEGADRVWHD